MIFSPVGLVLGAALTQNLADRNEATRIELLGGVFGATPLGLVLITTLAQQAGGGPGVRPVPGGAGAPTEAEVPNVTEADDLVAAGELVRSRGLTVAGTASVISEEAKDTILGSNPEAGAVVRLGAGVTILVSGGLRVPDVTGKKLTDAETEVQRDGFTPVPKETDVRGPADTVIKQDPAGGDFASKDDEVTLFFFKPRAAVAVAAPSAKSAPATTT
jgi:hypothetical protein